MNLSSISTEELMKMKGADEGNLSSISTEDLMKMKGSDDIDVNPARGFGENLKAGIGKKFVDTARAGGQMVRDFVNPSGSVRDLMRAQGKEMPRGLGDTVGDAIGAPTRADIDESRKLDAPLMKTGGGVVGNILGSAALAVPTVAIPGANTATGAGVVGGLMGLAEPVGTGESREKNVAIGTAVGGAAQAGIGKVAQVLKDRSTAKAAAAATSQAQNATRDTALASGRKAGYVVPPSSINPSLSNVAAESVAGKVSTAQAASAKNQGVTDGLAREALGLKKDSLLTEGSLRDMREQAGKAYEAIKNAPAIGPRAGVNKGGKVNWDPEFQTDIKAIGADLQQAAKDFPNSTKNKAIESLNQDLGKGSWTPTGIIEKVKLLRSDASANFKAFDDPEKLGLARAQRTAADALDDLMERHLTSIGQQQLSTDYKAARVLIAKTHDVEAALGRDGHIDARILARIGDRKPLTDQLAQIAEFAGSFPHAVQPATKTGSAGVHAIRSGAGAAVGMMMGGPAGAAVGSATGVAVPWTVRNMILSKPGQSLMANPSYATGKGMKRAGDLLASRAAKATLPAGTVGGFLE